MLSNKKALPLKSYDYGSACSCYMGTVIVLLGCQFLASIISIASTVVSTVTNSGGSGLAESGDFNAAFMIFMQIATALFVYAFSKIRKYRLNYGYFTHAETKKPPTVCDYVLPVVAAAVLMSAMYLPTTWFGYFEVYVLGIDPEAGAIKMDTVSSVVMIVIVTVFLAPVVEETIYRGVLFHGLKSEMKPVKAVMLSALSFMLMHMSPLQTIYQFSLGVLAAFIVYRSKKLLPAILLHAASNAIALIIECTPLGAAVGGSIEWLNNHVAAAFFITLGLLAAGGAVLFVTVRFGFGYSRRSVEKSAAVSDGAVPENAADQHDADSALRTAHVCENSVGEGVAPVADTPAVIKAKKSMGTLKYWLTIGICAVMFIVNLIFLVIG